MSMDNRSVGLKVFFWVEMILGACIFLYIVPILINKCLHGHVISSTLVADRFTIVLTFVAGFFVLCGLAGIAQMAIVRAAHVMTMLVVILLTLGLVKTMGQVGARPTLIYFLPVIFSGVLTATMFILNFFKK